MTGGSRDRLEHILARLAARPAAEPAFMTLYPDAARAAADEADLRRRANSSRGPLDGTIVSIKDVFDLAGEPTLAGSGLLRNAPAATEDALVVRRLRAAGAVILGKTHANEFCFTSDGINPHYGTPGNAADTTRIPGGSSSGAGVSAAEGTSEIAIGTDTGGSVRIPAALNGVVGFKPTARRVPRDGVFPLSPSLDSVGPLARSVAACAHADAVMAGETPADIAPRPLAGLRIGLPPAILMAETDPLIAERFAASLDRLGRRGTRLIRCPVDDLLLAMRDLTRDASIASIEAAQIHAEWLRAGIGPVDPRTAETLRRRLDFPEPVHRAMLQRRADLAAEMDRRLAGIDAFAAPTVPIFAPEIGRVRSDAAFAGHVEDLLLRNNQIANQFDLTAISLPLSDLPLPAGLLLTARPGQDRALLTLAASVERALAN